MTERYRLAGTGDWYEDVFRGEITFVGDHEETRRIVASKNKEWEDYIQEAAYDHSGVPVYLLEEGA